MLRNFFLACLIIACATIPKTCYATKFDMQALSKTPVLHEGRFKPMDSFARAILKRLSGDEKNAMMWLTETIFNPALAEHAAVIKIANPDVLNTLELERRKSKLFSYIEASQALTSKNNIITSILQTPQQDWTPSQKELIQLKENSVLLGDLLASLSAFIPLSIDIPDDAPKYLQKYKGRQLTYLETVEFQSELQKHVEKIVETKGQNFEQYTDTDKLVTQLSFTLWGIKNAGLRSNVFRIIPNKENNTWQSPWSHIKNNTNRLYKNDIFNQWISLTKSYHQQTPETWQTISENIYAVTSTSFRKHSPQYALELEALYNRLMPFKLSNTLYFMALLFLFCSMVFRQTILTKLAHFLLISGAGFHATGIFARIYILSRPPVSTLYESIIFVGAITVIYGLWRYKSDKRALWLLLSSALGLILHLLAFSHDMESDNLLVLTAVLNTNFWLSTHVICITTGYAFCLITSFFAHFILIKTLKSKTEHPAPKDFHTMHTAALIALLFTAVGTVLGGIWADQSWGRFWGWDPKENGALLIVLWLIWLLHGRISTKMSKIFVTAGLAYLSVIVGLSWVGVNLLNVGLHSSH